MSKAAAYLFGNGNAIFFDKAGKQIVDLQRLGLCGLHKFVERYPDAPIYWSIWKYGPSQEFIADELDRVSLAWLLRYIRKQPGPKPDVAYCASETIQTVNKNHPDHE